MIFWPMSSHGFCLDSNGLEMGRYRGGLYVNVCPPLRASNFDGFDDYDNRYDPQVQKDKVRFKIFRILKRAVDAFWKCQNVSKVRFALYPSQNASAGQIKNERGQKILLRNVIAPSRNRRPSPQPPPEGAITWSRRIS